VFGVFDGHGGREVAIFTQSHYEDILKRNENYKAGNYKEALRESFLQVDKEIAAEDGQEELANMKKKSPPNRAPLFKILGDINGSGGGGEQNREQMMLDCIGCTANVIFIDDMKKLYVANAGDSRCVLGRAG